MKNFILMVSLLVAALLASPAMAQDEGLYDPAAPTGSAFVRFINQGEKEEALKPSVNGKNFSKIAHGSIGPYVPVTPGNLEAELGTAKASGKAETGAYYTASLKGADFIILTDTATPATKAVIALYNLFAKPLSLKTADGKVEIIAATEPGKSSYREINAVPVTITAFEGDKKATDIPALNLKRGESTAILLTSKPDGTVAATVTQAATDTKQ